MLTDEFWLKLLEALETIAWRCWVKKALVGDSESMRRCQQLLPIAAKVYERVQSEEARNAVSWYCEEWAFHFRAPRHPR